MAATPYWSRKRETVVGLHYLLELFHTLKAEVNQRYRRCSIPFQKLIDLLDWHHVYLHFPADTARNSKSVVTH